MKFVVAATAGMFVGTAVAMAGPAAAAGLAQSSAGDAVASLRAQGYAVQLNGIVNGSLAQCVVTGVHGLPNTDPAGPRTEPNTFTTVYLDVECPSDD